MQPSARFGAFHPSCRDATRIVSKCRLPHVNCLKAVQIEPLADRQSSMSPSTAPVGRKILAISTTADIRLSRLRLAHYRVDTMPFGIIQRRFPCREPHLNLRPCVSRRCPAHQRVDLATSLVHELKHPVPGSRGAGRHCRLRRAVDECCHYDSLSAIAGTGSSALELGNGTNFPHCAVRSRNGLLPNPNLNIADAREVPEDLRARKMQSGQGISIAR